MSGQEDNKVMAAIRHREGYWRIIVRPAQFQADRVGKRLSELEEIARRCSVQIRGWDFPHISNQEDFTRGRDWIGQSTLWGYHRELWRLYLSGQFVFYGALWEDWLDESHWKREPAKDWQPGSELSIASTLYTYTEIFDLAARLCVTPAGAEEMVVDTTLFGLKGRRLSVGPNRMDFHTERRATVDSFPYRPAPIKRESLVAAPRGFAIDAANDLFQVFGWDADRQNLQGTLDELRR